MRSSLPKSIIAQTVVLVGIIGEGVTVHTNAGTGKKIVSRDEEIELIVPSSNTVEFPDNRNPASIKQYSHDTILKVESSVLKGVLDILKPYFAEVMNSKIVLTIDDDLAVSVKDSSNEVERHVPYKEVAPELIGKSYAISGTKILQLYPNFKGKELSIGLPLEETNPLVNFFNDESQHLVIARFKNEE